MFLLLISLFSFAHAGLYLHSNGTQELLPIENAAVILPNVTELRIEDTLVNLAAELVALRALVTRVGCAWQGVGCHCYYHENSLSTDSAVLIGSNCSEGTLYWVKALDIISACVVYGCQATNGTLCDFYFD